MRNPHGSIDKCKPKLVAKNFTQRYGIDYEQTYIHVTKIGSVRPTISIQANERNHLTQFDVSPGFLYGTLNEVRVHETTARHTKEGNTLLYYLLGYIALFTLL